MIRWNLPAGERFAHWWSRPGLWLSLVHVSLDIAWRPDECFIIQLTPLNWSHWGLWSNPVQVLYLGPISFAVHPREITWGR